MPLSNVPRWHPEIPYNGAPKFPAGRAESELEASGLVTELEGTFAKIYTSYDSTPAPSALSEAISDLTFEASWSGAGTSSSAKAEPEAKVLEPEAFKPELPPEEKAGGLRRLGNAALKGVINFLGSSEAAFALGAPNIVFSNSQPHKEFEEDEPSNP